MAIRYGGEEFLAILPATDAVAALAIAERVRAAIASHDWPRRPITASLGVATATAPIPSVDALLEEADEALYLAKRKGRNRVVHHQARRAPEATATA